MFEKPVELTDYAIMEDGDAHFVLGECGDASTAYLSLVVYNCARDAGGKEAITTKWLVGKDRRSHDEHTLQTLHRCTLWNGILGVTGRERIIRFHSARGALAAHSQLRHSRVIGTLLSLLNIEVEELGVTGRSLLVGSPQKDLDVNIYRADRADMVRQLAANVGNRLAPGIWSRPYHHRRFNLDGYEICPRFPLTWDEWRSVTSASAGSARRLRSGLYRIIDASRGVRFPAIYRLEWAGDRDQRVEPITCVTFEIAHSFAFTAGDRVTVTERPIHHTVDSGWTAYIHSGDQDAMVPYDYS